MRTKQFMPGDIVKLSPHYAKLAGGDPQHFEVVAEVVGSSKVRDNVGTEWWVGNQELVYVGRKTEGQSC